MTCSRASGLAPQSLVWRRLLSGAPRCLKIFNNTNASNNNNNVNNNNMNINSNSNSNSNDNNKP